MFSRLSTPARAGLAAAALVAAVVLGAAFLGNTAAPGIGGQPTPSAQPTPSTQPTPTPSSAPSVGIQPIDQAASAPCFEGGDPGGCTAPGTYSLDLDSLPGRITLDVPEGWSSWEPGPGALGLLVDSGSDAPDGSGWGLVLMTVGLVSRDPCDAGAGSFAPEDVDTPEELAAVMATTWHGYAATEPRAITLAGVPGVQVEVSTTDAIRACSTPLFWTTASFTAIDNYPMVDDDLETRPGTFRILDVDGELLVIRSTEFAETSPFELSQGVEPDPDRHAADLPEMQAIVESLRFGE